MHEHREVRVTARRSVRQDFIAPELSPVSVLDREMDKGITGWTDFTVKVPLENKTGLSVGHAERELSDMKVGTYTPKTPARREVARKRPSARRWS